MVCTDIEVLVEYCAGRLDAAAAARVQTHLNACAECRRFVEAQSTLWNELDALEPAPISADFDRKLWARIEQEQRPRAWALNWRAALSFALATALVFAAFVFQWPRPEPGSAKAQVETVELERALEDVEMLRQLAVDESQVM